MEGGHFTVGDVQRPGPLLIAEGFATAATLHEMTHMPAIAAFTAGNLLPVAQTYRALYPERDIYIAGDDDRQREAELDGQGRPKVNVGRVKAEEAAAAIGAQAVFPRFPADTQGTDWNDLAQALGRPKAARQLHQAIAIGQREQAVQGLDAAREDTELEQDRSPSRSIGRATGRTGATFGRDRAAARELEHDQGR